MRLTVLKFAAVCGFAAAWTGANLANAQEEEKKAKSKFWVEVKAEEDAEDDGKEKKSVYKYEVRKSSAPKYWIGVMLKSIEGDLAAHLASEEGVFIESVSEDSPAEKAGVKKGDIVVKVDDQPIGDLEAMMKAMREVGKEGKPSELKLTIVRKGEDVTVNVTPEKRPARLEEENEDITVQLLDGTKFEGLLKGGENRIVLDALLDEVAKGASGEAVKVLRLGSPKILTGGSVKSDLGVEGDVMLDVEGDLMLVVTKVEDEDGEEGEGRKITIKVEKKADDKKMKVTIEKDGETKEMEVEKLSELPEEVREAVGGVMPKVVGKNNVRVMNVFTEKAAEQREKAMQMARERVEAARAEARKAQAMAKENAAKATAMLRKTSGGEVDELKAMIEALRKEISALKKELNDR